MKTKKKENNVKKYVVIFSACLFISGAVNSQTQTYDNFEGNKSMYYGARTGALDTLAENPGANKINIKEKCAKYVRSAGQKFDNLKLNPFEKLSDVIKYSTYSGIPPVITMKVYTTAPVGTLIEIQMGKIGKAEYPAGINSQYQARTTVTNAWEIVQFKFSQIPKGSQTSAFQVDQITLLFNPNSSTKDTYYFADITGPSLAKSSELPVTPALNTKSTKK